MPNVVFFSFKEGDRGVVLTIKGRAVNPHYSALNFRVKDLLKRWDTQDAAVIKQAISKSISGTSRTIVFVGNNTWQSYWVPHEVDMTLAAGKPVYAIRLKDTNGAIPSCLSKNGIKVHAWSEPNLQALATM
ncbi:MAG: TIR domain-containing protein [Candidatus Thiodiazotropha weberae]|nr:TIR domain-containing protein [Candidatus Thiodiazotropha lotti]MCG8011193.1 TIR domain-containing protein [Candidatus Thiodiazotropha lotti]MCG8021963.1 TIR domain-containing protein [Candidatus Thiodiazotropha lotti]MCW4209135.1 TIR domain-containing protein [Candidatus Thiodiazotropha lotti]MCW4210655.1 TIR domain-containing protein [Candidatus Thiodiazotropha lotti]